MKAPALRSCRVLVAMAALAALASGAFVLSGGYNVAATDQHTAPVYALLDFVSKQSIVRHARGIDVPDLEDPAMIARGLTLFRAHCVQCHGAPGVAPAPFALGLTPVPANLAWIAGTRKPAEVYWTIRYGLKMTGMPAWQYRLDEGDLWAATAFVMRLPALSPADYRMLELQGPPADPAGLVSAEPVAEAPDVARGKQAIQQYACVTCHEIPGVVGANHPVGPPLARLALRGFLSGTSPNNHANLVAWLRDPAAVDPDTAMPNLGLSERDAADIAAFLGTLR